LQAALDREYKQINEESGTLAVDGISGEEVTSLKQRIVSVERSVEGVLSKVDSVLSRLEFNEKSQGKRREVLTKLLNPLIQVRDTCIYQQMAMCQPCITIIIIINTIVK